MRESEEYIKLKKELAAVLLLVAIVKYSKKDMDRIDYIVSEHVNDILDIFHEYEENTQEDYYNAE